MRVDIRKPDLNFRDAVWIAGVIRLLDQVRAFHIRRKHPFDERVVSAGRLLFDMADPCALGIIDGAVVGVEFPRNEFQERGFAGAVAPDEADLVPSRNSSRCALENRPAVNAKGKLVDVQHDGWR